MIGVLRLFDVPVVERQIVFDAGSVVGTRGLVVDMEGERGASGSRFSLSSHSRPALGDCSFSSPPNNLKKDDGET